MCKTARVLCLLVVTTAVGFAHVVDTVAFRAVMTTANEVPPVTGVEASADALILVHVTRTGSGISGGVVDFEVGVNFVGAAEFVGLHIHEAPAGQNAGVVIGTDLSANNAVSHAGGESFVSRQVVVTDGALLSRLLQNPGGFYVNMHTRVNPGGVIRGQLAPVDSLVLRTTLSPQNEVPPIPNLDASGSANIRIFADRDASGQITGGGVFFHVNHRFALAHDLTGLHIHNGPAGQNAGVVIGTDLSGNNPIRGATTGAITKLVPIRTPAQLAALRGLFESPQGFYSNLHTTVNSGGAIRGQLLNTGTIFLRSDLSPANEVPPITGLQGDAVAKITANFTRDATRITGAMVTFDVNYQGFPAGTTFTGLHIHNGPAGSNAGVVISSGLSATDSVTSATGAGNIFRIVNVDVDTPAALNALNAMLADPDKFYVNLHTTVNPGGAVRGQMGTALTAAPQINAGGVISAVLDAAIGAASPGALISIFGTNLSQNTTEASGLEFPGLPIDLSGAQVGIGGRLAPLLFVSPTQINAQVPFETQSGNVEVFVKRSDTFGPPLRLSVRDTSPGIFVTQLGAAVLKNADFSLVSATNPAAAGEVVSIFCTGLGRVTPQIPSGQLAPTLGTISLTVAQPSVTVGGRTAEVLASSLAPGFAGLYQVAIRMPSGVSAGNQSVVVTVGDQRSNAAPMAVR